MSDDSDDSNADREQLHVIALVNRINTLLAGETVAIAHTTLTMAVVSAIVNTARTADERVPMARGLADQIANAVQREDIVAWIKSSTIHPTRQWDRSKDH